jgi:tRNA threonylcarbamoyl adenosine modification protein YeaZ
MANSSEMTAERITLAFDASTAACTAALFDDSGTCIARADERIDRGHAERLVPMIDELLAGRHPDRILVGVGPGSFTGIRVAVAAAHGLAIGWNVDLWGMSSLALLAAEAVGEGEVAAAIDGGHGELFVPCFDAVTLQEAGPLLNLPPAEAAKAVGAARAIGPAARRLIDARGSGEAIEALPSASSALRLPTSLRSLAAKPLYARPPDAKAKAA